MPCPFCQCAGFSSTEYPVNHFNGKQFKYLRCKQCRLVYLDPFPDQSDYEQMYPTSYQSNEADLSIRPDLYKKMPGLRFSYGYQFDQVKKEAGPDAYILDYGCGNGNFIANALYAGFRCAGAEFNPDFVAILRKAFPRVNFYTIGELLEGTPGLQFDVIRLSNVLEHLTNPVEVIEKLKSYLKPNGVLLVEGPVEDNFCIAKMSRSLYFRTRKTLKRGWVISSPPYHIFLSNRKNQRDFFERCGFSESLFKVTEDAWPFPVSFSSAKGLTQKINALTAKLSISVSKLSGQKFGNTFIYAGRKSKPAKTNEN